MERKKMRGLCGVQQVGHRRCPLYFSWTKVRAARLLLHLLPVNTNPSLMAVSSKILGSDLVALVSALDTGQGMPRRHRSQERWAKVGL